MPLQPKYPYQNFYDLKLIKNMIVKKSRTLMRKTKKVTTLPRIRKGYLQRTKSQEGYNQEPEKFQLTNQEPGKAYRQRTRKGLPLSTTH